jgi:hydrogenase maturation protease
LNRILVIGYGNPDRQDDGVAWHILRALAKKLDLPTPLTYDDEFPINDRLDFAFYLQLTPEMAEELSAYERVCFVDAHTGDIPQPVRMIEVQSEFQRSPFTHHLTPQSLVAMCATIYGRQPQAALLSVRGYRFLFDRELSPETSALVEQAVELIETWIQKDGRNQ